MPGNGAGSDLYLLTVAEMRKITIYALALFCSCGGRNQPKPAVAVAVPKDTVQTHLSIGILKNETAQENPPQNDAIKNATIKKPKTNTTMDDLKLTNDFEWFDQARFDQRPNKKSDSWEMYLPNGTYIQLMDDAVGSRSGKEAEKKYYTAIPKDSYFMLRKVYYPSGRIWTKGWAYVDFFEKGVWPNFDDDGNLSFKYDWDNLFTFTFEDVLKFCQKNGIKVEKGRIIKPGSGITTSIKRYTIGDRCWWEIRYEKNWIQIETIYLDGRNGKIVHRESVDFNPG